MPKNVILRCVALCSVLTTIPLLGCGSATRAGAELEGVATTPSAFITAAGDIAFNFDDGTTQGWTVAWGSAFDPAKASVENTTALARGTNPGALAVNIAYTGAGFEEANVQALLQAGGAKLDLSAFSSLEYDVFIPNPSQFTGTLKVETALSADFAEVGTFSDVNVAALPQQTINGAAYAQLHVKVGHDLLADKNRSSLLVIRLAAGGSTYHGPLYIDDVHLTKVVVPLGSGAVVWDFEDGTTQGWAQAWGSAFDPSKPAVQNSAAIASAGDAGALAVNVAYKGGGFEEANVAASINGSGVKVDLGAFERLTYDVYVPNPQNFTGTLKLLTALNDPYGELTAFQDYSPASMPQETINGVSYVVIHRVVSNDALSTHPPNSQLVVRLAASASTYVGPIYHYCEGSRARRGVTLSRPCRWSSRRSR